MRIGTIGQLRVLATASGERLIEAADLVEESPPYPQISARSRAEEIVALRGEAIRLVNVFGQRRWIRFPLPEQVRDRTSTNANHRRGNTVN